MQNPPITLAGSELGTHQSTKELRHAAMRFAESHFIGREFTNADSGHAIKVTRQGMKHSLASTNAPEVCISVALGEMLQFASYVGAKEPTPKHLQRGILLMHEYLAVVELAGERLRVGLVTHERSGGHEHYNHAIVAKS